MHGRYVACLGLLLAACDSSECERADCSSDVVQIAFVDDAGDPVIAKGEYRALRGAVVALQLAFDCSTEPGASDADGTCIDSELSVGPPWSADYAVEVRFALADGEFTDWQAVPLEVTTVTDPDYNGPGCECSRYEGSAEPVVVPEEARP